MDMTNSEICRTYRLAKNRDEQIQILADRNCTSRAEIIGILINGGENVRIPLPASGRRKKDMTDKQYYKALVKRMDTLDAEISKREKEYLAIAAVLKGWKGT